MLALEYASNLQRTCDLVCDIPRKQLVALARCVVGVGKEENNVVRGGGQVDEAGCNAIQHLQIRSRAIVDLVDFVERLGMRRQRRRAEEEGARGHGGVMRAEICEGMWW